ncbi:MAG: DUF455 family protein, partial [Verrucomicrobiota bacterium]
MSGSRISSSLPSDPSSEQSLSAVAERILFSSSLEEKLRAFDCGLSADGRDGISPSSLHSFEPSRPENLRFASPSEAKPRLPSSSALVDEENRGVLLHFFANHELLATELMALALLRFPDAPEAFRRGLARTLREEQRHTLWYVQRMEECGIEFGQYPLNRFFWDAVSSMKDPTDYVARLSLTFEQANLDYSKHFALLLREAGDGK